MIKIYSSMNNSNVEQITMDERQFIWNGNADTMTEVIVGEDIYIYVLETQDDKMEYYSEIRDDDYGFIFKEIPSDLDKFLRRVLNID